MFSIENAGVIFRIFARCQPFPLLTLFTACMYQKMGVGPTASSGSGPLSKVREGHFTNLPASPLSVPSMSSEQKNSKTGAEKFCLFTLKAEL